MAPSYFFSVTPMRQRDGSPRRLTFDEIWLPPKELGNNVPYIRHTDDENFVAPVYFHYTGLQAEPRGEFPASVQHYKTYSIYYSQGTIWTVNYDAIRYPVHDGQDAATMLYAIPMSPIPGMGDDWSTMNFHHFPQFVSYAGRRLEHQRLRIQRPEQNWARQILPDNYTAHEETQQHSLGGLVGELPLLIGLMALAVPEGHVHMALRDLMHNPWHVLPQGTLTRGAGWQEGRGLVVSIYIDPMYTSPDDLHQYENGATGEKILP